MEARHPVGARAAPLAASKLDLFRADLSAALRLRAERHRQVIGASGDLAGDLRTIRLLDDLADGAARLSPRVFLLHRALATSTATARICVRDTDRLLDRVGVDCVPADADDLVRWMVRQVVDAAAREGEPRRVPSGPARFGLALTLALDLSAGFGVVAPLTAAWQARAGIDQWRDRAFATSHPPVAATVETKAPAGEGRGGHITAAGLAFVPAPRRAACHVTVTGGAGYDFPPVGATLTVVPRDEGCARPIVPSQIGDPFTSAALSAGLLAFGLASLTLWSALRRRHGWVSPPLPRSAYRAPPRRRAP